MKTKSHEEKSQDTPASITFVSLRVSWWFTLLNMNTNTVDKD